jgi:hypothetical protein
MDADAQASPCEPWESLVAIYIAPIGRVASWLALTLFLRAVLGGNDLPMLVGFVLHSY